MGCLDGSQGHVCLKRRWTQLAGFVQLFSLQGGNMQLDRIILRVVALVLLWPGANL
jgi:hypothetical protein